MDEEEEMWAGVWWCGGGEGEWEVGVEAVEERVELVLASSSTMGARSELGSSDE